MGFLQQAKVTMRENRPRLDRGMKEGRGTRCDICGALLEISTDGHGHLLEWCDNGCYPAGEVKRK